MQQSGSYDDGTRSRERKRKRWDIGPDGEEMPLRGIPEHSDSASKFLFTARRAANSDIRM